MLFNSFAFLIFLPLFMIGYWSTRGRARPWVMFLSSLDGVHMNANGSEVFLRMLCRDGVLKCQ